MHLFDMTSGDETPNHALQGGVRRRYAYSVNDVL
jgi:hypothetical protein